MRLTSRDAIATEPEFLEETWRVTLRAGRRDLVETVLLGAVALVSGILLALSLYAIYSALGGVN